MIQWEPDWPDQHPGQKLPVLDLLICKDKEDLSPIFIYQKLMTNKSLVAFFSCMPLDMIFTRELTFLIAILPVKTV